MIRRRARGQSLEGGARGRQERDFSFKGLLERELQAQRRAEWCYGLCILLLETLLAQVLHCFLPRAPTPSLDCNSIPGYP